MPSPFRSLLPPLLWFGIGGGFFFFLLTAVELVL